MAFLAVFSLLCLLQNTGAQLFSPGDFSQFNLEAAGPYTAYGTYTVVSPYPQYTTLAPVPATVYVDPVNQIFAIVTNSTYGSQYITANGFFYTAPLAGLPCASSTTNYAQFVQAYKQAIQTQVFKAGLLLPFTRKFYSGFVRDPGSGPTYSGISIVTDGAGFLHTYTQDQTLFNAAVNVVVKSHAQIDISTYSSLKSVVLPSDCSGEDVPPYDAIFYPPGPNYVMAN